MIKIIVLNNRMMSFKLLFFLIIPRSLIIPQGIIGGGNHLGVKFEIRSLFADLTWAGCDAAPGAFANQRQGCPQVSLSCAAARPWPLQ